MIKYIKGYCTISIEGMYLEKFITSLAKRGIQLYNIKRISSNKIYADIYKSELRVVLKLYEKSKYDITIKKSIGIPFVMMKIYKRKTLLIASLVSMFILFYISTLVTNVYIKSPEGVDVDLLRIELYKNGLKPFTSKYLINKKNISDAMIVKFKNIAYLSINVKGTNVYVNVIKKSDEPKNTTSINCNIIARKNGIIDKVISRSGDPLVNEGDVVKKGDVLIAGSNNLAKGEVWAKTFYEVKDSLKYESRIKEKTGKKLCVYNIDFFGKTYNVKRKIPYKNYITDEDEYFVSFGKWKVPVYVKKTSFYEVNIKENKTNLKLLQNRLKQRASKKFDYMISSSARILKMDENYKVINGNLVLLLTLECLENIAKEQMIKGGTPIENPEENVN